MAGVIGVPVPWPAAEERRHAHEIAIVLLQRMEALIAVDLPQNRKVVIHSHAGEILLMAGGVPGVIGVPAQLFAAEGTRHGHAFVIALPPPMEGATAVDLLANLKIAIPKPLNLVR